ncbi:hypothetical protein PUW79_01835 [Microbacterium sp. NE2HP2]|uniref:hypothetical protein n=1 Tax=Microbacterium TaxID=33882 RepID=UPI000DCCB044|nr:MULTISPECIES: hypothetical protein [Microbacterium]MDD7943371.1 hypothetical protein [Microbacterium plantarum]RAZ34587.1 hypothetical protein DO944_01720 [Microbacterium sp. SMR1]WHE37341.1 hypothetical protein P6897_06405 [Microbacterium sp. BDGP8]WRK18520.1 hypothetical protein VC184_05780 [Microbacterium plantarum]
MNDIECSRAGCRASARWRVIWRNPRIHTADRRKIWVACDDHVAYLREFVAARDFPVSVERLVVDNSEAGGS